MNKKTLKTKEQELKNHEKFKHLNDGTIGGFMKYFSERFNYENKITKTKL